MYNPPFLGFPFLASLVLEYRGSPIPRVSTYFIPFCPYKYGCRPLSLLPDGLSDLCFLLWKIQPCSPLHKDLCESDFQIQSLLEASPQLHLPTLSARCSLMESSQLLLLWMNPIWHCSASHILWLPFLSSFLSYSSTWFFSWGPKSVFLSQRIFPEPVTAPTPNLPTSPPPN